MESGIISKYAVLTRATKLRLQQSTETQLENDNDGSNCEEICFNAGQLLKIFKLNKPSERGQNNAGSDLKKIVCTVQVLDLVNNAPIFENLYECPQENLRRVDDVLWPYIISIADPEQRLKMLKDENNCKFVPHLKINDVVIVSGAMNNEPEKNYDCIIRYIGPVWELRPVGYLFGLELLNFDNGKSPQADKIPFSAKYFECDPVLLIFTTANWIKPMSKEQQKKFSTCVFLNGKIEKFKSYIAPSRVVMGRGGNNTSRKETKGRKKTTNTVCIQTQPQGRILKNKDQIKTTQSTMLNADADIDESVRNEPDVLVFEKEQKHVDLCHLLGSDWPNSAGCAAKILNELQSTNVTQQHGSVNSNCRSTSDNNVQIAIKSNRSKFSNPLSHLGANVNGKSNDSISFNNKNADNKKKQNSTYDFLEFLPAVLPIPTMKDVPDTDLGVGSMVEVNVPESSENLHGVKRWIGKPIGMKNILIGVELDDDYVDKHLSTTNGDLNGIPLFKCTAGRGLFVNSNQCSIDRRFLGADGGAISNRIRETNENKTKRTNGFHADQPKAVAPMTNAQNVRLSEENDLLRRKLHDLTNQKHSSSTIHIEAKLKAFKMEEECDRLFEKLEKTKRKYNQLYDAYLQKVKRCKAYEEVFNRQKTLNGLVMKSSVDQRQKEQNVAAENSRRLANIEENTVATLQSQVAKLQTALDEAYDIIDELEFELESVDFLEIENERLRNELDTYKKEKLKLKKEINSNHPVEYLQSAQSDGTKMFDESDMEQPQYREYNGIARRATDSNASSLADSIVGEIDPETMERAALTESLINSAESESNCLRRELLRSRLRNAVRRSVRPTSSDA